MDRLDDQLAPAEMAEYWRLRAEELRVFGENLKNPASRRILLEMANEWDRRAKSAEARAQAVAKKSR